MATRRLAALLFAAGLVAAAPASAQFVSFTRCHAAFPCNEAFGLQYRPDPLIAGPWASSVPSSAVSAHIELKSEPKVQVDTRPDGSSDDVLDASVRSFLKRHPAPKRVPDTAPAKPADPAPDPQKP
jgi:hypothetical protein